MLVVCRAAGRRTGGNSLPEYWQLASTRVEYTEKAASTARVCRRPLAAAVLPLEFLGYGHEIDQGACWCVVLEVTPAHIHTHSML
jgi:hypothetical protein